MHLSRLFSAMIVVAVGAGATVVACGGSSSPNKTPDAKVFKDAKVFMDAPGGSSAAGIGAACGNGSGNASLCPTADPICTSLTGSAWFCTEGCGYGSCATGGTFGSSSCQGTGSSQPMAPSGGTAICQQQAGTTTATPVCALYSDGPNAGSAIAWACGLACGTNGSANYGTCPSNLACVDFTGKTYGFCQ